MRSRSGSTRCDQRDRFDSRRVALDRAADHTARVGFPEPQPDRRPIRARDAAWARWIAGALLRLGVAPNAISASSILFAVVGGAALVATDHATSHGVTAILFLSAALCIQLRLLANLFDGMVATEGGRPRDPLGGLWNEVPDRVTDVCLLVGAGYALGGSPALGWLAAVFAVTTAYVRAQGASLGARQHFVGPMAKQQRMALLTLAALVAAALPPAQQVHAWSPLRIALVLIVAGCAITIPRRLARIAADLRSAPESVS